MNLKTFLSFTALALSFCAGAQDKIYKKNGEVLDAKVKSVGGTTISYKRFSNPDGPDYTIFKKEVSKIVYENGTKDVFDRGYSGASENTHEKGPKAGKNTKNKFGNNILTIMPGVFTEETEGMMHDAGVGISYERLLDENGHIGFLLPVIISFASGNDYTDHMSSVSSYRADYGTYNSFMFAPGVKFYPAPGTARFRYSMGASFFALFGNEPYEVYENYPYSSMHIPGDWHYTVYGAMFSNALNATVTKHLFVAFDLGLGVPFSDNRLRDHSFFDNPFPLIQFGLKIGARF